MTKRFKTENRLIEYRTLEEVLELVKSLGLSHTQVTFHTEDIGEFSECYNAHISFSRLETDAEYAARLDHEQKYKQNVEQREREEYERLRKKFSN